MEGAMPDEVVYIDRFEIRDGKLEEFKRYAEEMAAFVEQEEPGVSAFNYFVDEVEGRGTAVFVFSDADALDRHLDVASSKFQQGYELLSGTKIELLGPASQRAAEMSRSFGASLKQRLAGFSRST
jgi:quinol monooxygenase YgiN